MIGATTAMAFGSSSFQLCGMGIDGFIVVFQRCQPKSAFLLDVGQRRITVQVPQSQTVGASIHCSNSTAAGRQRIQDSTRNQRYPAAFH